MTYVKELYTSASRDTIKEEILKYTGEELDKYFLTIARSMNIIKKDTISRIKVYWIE